MLFLIYENRLKIRLAQYLYWNRRILIEKLNEIVYNLISYVQIEKGINEQKSKRLVNLWRKYILSLCKLVQQHELWINRKYAYH